jgi:hypothetical protein
MLKDMLEFTFVLLVVCLFLYLIGQIYHPLLSILLTIGIAYSVYILEIGFKFNAWVLIVLLPVIWHEDLLDLAISNSVGTMHEVFGTIPWYGEWYVALSGMIALILYSIFINRWWRF